MTVIKEATAVQRKGSRPPDHHQSSYWRSQLKTIQRVQLNIAREGSVHRAFLLDKDGVARVVLLV